jgi:hypothetical protein
MTYARRVIFRVRKRTVWTEPRVLTLLRAQTCSHIVSFRECPFRQQKSLWGPWGELEDQCP